MSKSVTMQDIGEALGISTVSVSKALSGKDGVSSDVRERIEKKAIEMGYVYASRASSATSGIGGNEGRVRGFVGVLVADRFFSAASYYADVYASLSTELSKEGILSTLEVLSAESEDCLIPPAFLTNRQVIAFVALGQFSQQYVNSLKSSSVPYVLLDFYDVEGGNDSIVCDSMYGSYLLTDYLIKQGHKDIGFIGNIKATSSIMDRYLGYHCAIIRNNLVTRAECLVMDRDATLTSRMYKSFRLPEKLPDAFVCNCDDTALVLVRQLNSMGIKVPDDISVVGYDDHVSSTICDPPLTTFKVDKKALSNACVLALKEKIIHPATHIRQKITGGEIIYRESVKAI